MLTVRNCNIDGELKDVTVEGGAFTAVVAAGSGTPGSAGGNGAPAESAEYDAAGNIAVVGLADTHMHLDKSKLCIRAPYQDVIAPEKGRLTREQKASLSEEDIYQNARSVILRAIGNGTVAIRTNVDVDPVVGLRGVAALLRLREEFKDQLTLQAVPFAQEGIFNYPETPDLLREALKMGGDGVGGHTIIDGPAHGEAHIDIILDIAAEFGVTCDFHVDESGKPEHFLLPYLARQTIKRGLQGRVHGIHACSLAAMEEDVVAAAIELSVEAQLRFIIAPTAISTRQLTLSKRLLAAGLPVTLGSDNVGDFFNPYGDGAVLHVAHLLTYVHRYFTEEERLQILGMVTGSADGLFGRKLDGAGIQPGEKADLTILDGTDPRELLSRIAAPRLVVRNGRVVSRREESTAER